MNQLEFIEEYLDYDQCAQVDSNGNEEGPGSCNAWLPLKSARHIRCRIGPIHDPISADNFEMLSFLTDRVLQRFPSIDQVILGREPTFFRNQLGLTVVKVPDYLECLLYARYDIRPIPIQGKFVSAIAFGNHAGFSLGLPQVGKRSVVKLDAVTYRAEALSLLAPQVCKGDLHALEAPHAIELPPPGGRPGRKNRLQGGLKTS